MLSRWECEQPPTTTRKDFIMIDQDLCEHENATVEYLTYAKASWWADAHCYVNDDSEDLPTLVCPDCGLEEIQEREEPDYD